VLHGQPDGGLASEGSADRRFALIHTGGRGGANNWLIHLMKHQPGSKAESEAKPNAKQKAEPAAKPNQRHIFDHQPSQYPLKNA
jgi:bifunctional non-homologous end joining protein LigD